MSGASARKTAAKKASRVRRSPGGAARPRHLRVLEMSTPDLIRRVERGVAFRDFEALCNRLDLSANELADVVRIPVRTLSRRRQSKRLQTDESERLLRIERLLALATEMLRDEVSARYWMKSSKKALAGKTPLEYAETEIGAREVEDLIGRIRHGVSV